MTTNRVKEALAALPENLGLNREFMHEAYLLQQRLSRLHKQDIALYVLEWLEENAGHPYTLHLSPLSDGAVECYTVKRDHLRVMDIDEQAKSLAKGLTEMLTLLREEPEFKEQLVVAINDSGWQKEEALEVMRGLMKKEGMIEWWDGYLSLRLQSELDAGVPQASSDSRTPRM